MLFFIHGGAFVTGGGADYDGGFLATHGPAVIVTINYRLGPLGFLQLHRHGLDQANNLAISMRSLRSTGCTPTSRISAAIRAR